MAQLSVDSFAQADDCPHQTQPPQAVIDFIKNLTEPVLAIVDFDETLFLRNSTEEYLSTARPRFLCAVFLIFLDKLKPWNVLPQPFRGAESRDWLRVVLVTLLFPWTWLLWRRRAKALMTTHENHLLSQALAHSQQATPVIASRGFEFIIQPLARYLSIQPQQVIGCRFWAGGRDRHKGKEELIADRIDDDAVQNGILVTDSTDDASLLEVVKYPFLVQWPGARYVPAFSNIYLPFFYLERVKRPDSNFTYQVVIKNHLLSLVLAISWLSSLPLLHVVGTSFLVFSFWCIYEIGYFENDQVAEKYEKKPVLSKTYHQYKSRMDVHQPWIFASIAGLIGVALTYLSNHAQGYSWASLQSTLSQPDQWGIALDFTFWMGILLSIRGLYLGYNYLDEKTRVWVYPFLQISKYLSFLAFTHASKVGLALLIANIFVDWVPYIIYRCGGQRDEFEEQIMRLFIFLLICVGSAFFLHEVEFLKNWQFAVILLWLSIRIRPQLRKLISNAHFVWH
ncbi:haloacid dehalogenase-like hydrolase [Nodosilinea sp. P-1105]|uniref:haloacid dehalogenase-like hydrolase n=1 Tax=Nodosilinea sp. P-1105 TaxID=2546229 RepID=UPI00146B3FC1|nr:haloacid dehalogenase-like hydrolase [Nodosilinea sp. P-1105]NMF82607.1 haloacid dehalogenase-like hydrolase [Nodosilinea sp. P-1105]